MAASGGCGVVRMRACRAQWPESPIPITPKLRIGISSGEVDRREEFHGMPPIGAKAPRGRRRARRSPAGGGQDIGRQPPLAAIPRRRVAGPPRASRVRSDRRGGRRPVGARRGTAAGATPPQRHAVGRVARTAQSHADLGGRAGRRTGRRVGHVDRGQQRRRRGRGGSRRRRHHGAKENSAQVHEGGVSGGGDRGRGGHCADTSWSLAPRSTEGPSGDAAGRPCARPQPGPGGGAEHRPVGRTSAARSPVTTPSSSRSRTEASGPASPCSTAQR